MIGIDPIIIIPEVDENKKAGESIEEYIRRVTISKGKAIYKEEFHDIPVISSDTIVLCEDRVIGKPSSREEAYEFLKILSGNTHEVLTGVSILYKGIPYYDYARTKVVFTGIAEEELRFYLDTEDYMDKAGAYAIQGKASVFIERIDGCFFNVMGFPLNLFYNMLKKMGIILYSFSI